MGDPVQHLTAFFDIPSGRIVVEDNENSLLWFVATE
jgi:hypothetical protein